MKGTFAGANIKGNPKMRSWQVGHDLKVLMKRADAFGVQEFQWAAYWVVAFKLLNLLWGSYPGMKVSQKKFTAGGQAIFWKRAIWKKLQTYSRPAFDFNLDNSGIMPNRWIRAVLLQNRKGRFATWFLSTHFVVGGDSASDSDRRKNFLLQNIDALDQMLTYLTRTGFPIMGEIDANIHPGSWGYSHFMEMMTKHNATFHGQLGVEYAFTIPGLHGHFTNVDPSVIPTSQLETDHEARVLEWKGHYNH